MTSRRDFLRTSSLALSAMGLATLPGLAGALGRSRFDRISVGETFVFPEWLSAMAEVTGRNPHSADRTFWTVWQSAGASMFTPVQSGELSLVTLPAPGVEPFGVAQARSLAIQANDRLAEKMAGAAGMAGLATLAAFDPLAAKEAERAITRLGLVGLSLGANRGMRLDHRSLWPVYEYAASANVPVYLPAAYTSHSGDSPYRTLGNAGVIAGAAADSGRHATQLIFGGVLDAFPDLTVVLSRLGEGTPYWYGRIQETYASVQDAAGPLPKRPAHEYFKDNILLTTTDMTPQTVQFCSALLGNGRVVSSHEESGRRLVENAALGSLYRLTEIETSRLVAWHKFSGSADAIPPSAFT
jgi:predicted TIM-barrel fold metal-dependent hydrolase